jgi:catechol 2,3-dioxygenase-like lactoylglutathione lyase family enzyme
MIRIATVQLWVHDQDAALDFYTKKVGLELRSDVTLPEMGDFRWLTVGPAGQDDVAIVLMAIPGPPVMDEDHRPAGPRPQRQGLRRHRLPHDGRRAGQLRDAPGRGVEFTEAPEERPYGIDCAFRDPSGNSIRLTQVRELANV